MRENNAHPEVIVYFGHLMMCLPLPERRKGTAKRYQQTKKTEEAKEACDAEGLTIESLTINYEKSLRKKLSER